MANLRDIEKRIRRIEEHLGLKRYHDHKLEELLEGLDKRTLMEIWNGVSSRSLAFALVGLKKEHVERVRETVSKNRWAEIQKDLFSEDFKEIKPSTIQSSREDIIDVVRDLESMGEIIICASEEERKAWVAESNARAALPPEKPFDVENWIHTVFKKIDE